MIAFTWLLVAYTGATSRWLAALTTAVFAPSGSTSSNRSPWILAR